MHEREDVHDDFYHASFSTFTFYFIIIGWQRSQGIFAPISFFLSWTLHFVHIYDFIISHTIQSLWKYIFSLHRIDHTRIFA